MKGYNEGVADKTYQDQVSKELYQEAMRTQEQNSARSAEAVVNDLTGAVYFKDTDPHTGEEILIPESKYPEFIQNKAEVEFAQGQGADVLNLDELETK